MLNYYRYFIKFYVFLYLIISTSYGSTIKSNFNEVEEDYQFSRLPTEILTQVLSYLDQNELFKYRLVNKGFNEVIKEEIRPSYKLSWQESFDNAEDMTFLMKFLRESSATISSLTLISFSAKEIIFDFIGKELIKLKKLDLKLSPKVNDDILSYLSESQYLQELHIDGNNISYSGLSFFKNFSNLRYINISNLSGFDEALNYFQSSSTSLNFIELSGKRKERYATTLRDVKSFSNLEGLNLNYRHLQKEAFNEFLYLTKLESLSLGNTNVSNKDLYSLNAISTLKILDLSYTDIDLSFLYKNALKGNFQNLEKLLLDGSKFYVKLSKFLDAFTKLKIISLNDLQRKTEDYFHDSRREDISDEEILEYYQEKSGISISSLQHKSFIKAHIKDPHLLSIQIDIKSQDLIKYYVKRGYIKFLRKS